MKLTKTEERFLNEKSERRECPGIVNSKYNYKHNLTGVERKGKIEHVCLIRECSNYGKSE